MKSCQVFHTFLSYYFKTFLSICAIMIVINLDYDNLLMAAVSAQQNQSYDLVVWA